jgi:hypothetical protein
MARFFPIGATMQIPKDKVQAMRQQRLERSGAYPVQSEADALCFLDNVGICSFSHHGDVDLPCFSDALAEQVRDEAWGWKDSLPNTRKIYYGSLFRFLERDAIRPGFLALRVLTACYALAPVMQFGGDPSLLPRWTGLSREALGLVDTLEREGSLSTSALRQATGLNGKTHNTLFTKVLIEAQRNFLIVRTGVTSTSRANYGYIWEIFPRAYPAIVAEAEGLSELAAAERIVSQYVDTAVVATAERISSVFMLTLAVLRKAADQLVEKGALCQDDAGILVNASF